MHDIMKGERYWLDDTDEAIVKEYNREFERVDPLEELFLCHFRGAEESEEGEWLTAMQIFNDLQQKTMDKLAINRIAAFGRTLRKLDILNKKSNRGTLYHLVRIEEWAGTPTDCTKVRANLALTLFIKSISVRSWCSSTIINKVNSWLFANYDW